MTSRGRIKQAKSHDIIGGENQITSWKGITDPDNKDLRIYFDWISIRLDSGGSLANQMLSKTPLLFTRNIS